MEAEQPAKRSTRGAWGTKKKVEAPRGVYRHPSGDWPIRYTCGAGHIHKDRVGRVKNDAKDMRAMRVRDREPGWCPIIEARQARERVQAELRQEKMRLLFKEYAAEYEKYAEANKRSWKTDKGRIAVLNERFGTRKLDEITPADVERLRDWVRETRSVATANRYRDLVSAIFKRAIRDGHVSVNRVRTVSKFKENNERRT